MPFHVPQEESLDPAALHALQREKLARMLAVVRSTNLFHRGKLAGLVPDSSAVELTRAPLTTRAELQQDQEAHPPYGTNLSCLPSAYVRLHQTSGSTGSAPLRWLDTAESWDWCLKCWSIVYRGAGLRAEDRLVFPFSFGPFLGFWMAFEAACRLGNFCLAAGGMSTSARLRYLLDNGATVVCCTPTYALHLAETAAREGVDLAQSAVRMLIVAGEPGGSIPSVRLRIEEAWGARVIDHAGMTETGAWGFECAEAPGGMHVIESEFIAEVLDPAALAPVADGEIGELVLTNLGRIGSPLIRYRTGDLVRLTRGRCACGRWFARVEGGVLGRIDDMLIVRGNNVFPSAVEGVLREFPEIAEFRLTPTTRGAMTDLKIEIELVSKAGVSRPDQASFLTCVAAAVKDRMNFHPLIEIVDAGTLPRFDMKARRVKKD